MKLFVQKVTAYLKPKCCQQLITTAMRRQSSLPPLASMKEASDTQTKTEKSMNHVSLLGRVGGEPQMRGSEKHPVVIFSLATNNKYENADGGSMQKTDWHRISVFKPALRDTVYSYMQKGQRVFVTGKISYGIIKDEAGMERQTTSIIADDVIFFQNA